MEQPKNYEGEFALVYDELMSSSKYNRWKGIIENAVKKYNIPKTCALDVACGTGKISLILLDLGFEKVYGLDRSNSMLEICREKLKAYGDRFEAVEKDMVSIDESDRYDMIVSFYDSINYLLDPLQVDRFLGELERALKPGGIAIFDMNTKEHVKISQRNPKREFKTTRGKASLTFGGEKDIWQLDIEIERDGHRFRETHLERGYSSEDIRGMMKGKDLVLLELLSENKTYWDGKEHLSRQYYILKKSL